MPIENGEARKTASTKKDNLWAFEMPLSEPEFELENNIFDHYTDRRSPQTGKSF